jgi:hypothetical protein
MQPIFDIGYATGFHNGLILGASIGALASGLFAVIVEQLGKVIFGSLRSSGVLPGTDHRSR